LSYGKYTIKLRHKHNSFYIFCPFIGVLRYYNLSLVGHGTYYATKYGTCYYTGGNITGRSMTGVHHWRMMYVWRYGFAEEFVGVIVAIIVSPTTIHII
jgi:hypothetical protein